MFGFEFIFIIGFVIFALAFGVIIFAFAKGIAQWNKNNHSPRLTVNATVVTKRTSVSTHHHHGAGAGMHMSSSTSYYVTFQVDSGDRMELYLGGREYGELAEGDVGKLTFQGTRYLGFERLVQPEDTGRFH